MDQLARLQKLSVTQLCDAYDQIRLISASLQPLFHDIKMIGKAFTVQSDGDLLPIIKALDIAEPGSVILIDSSNTNRALAGEIFATTAKKRGLAGIIIDGYCRDIDAIRKIKFPFYAKGVCAKAGTKEKPGKLQVAIQCGGVKVSPGEIILGDENGIIVCSENELNDILPLAEQIKAKEEEALRKIYLGANLVDMFNFEEHYHNILSGRESKFGWS